MLPNHTQLDINALTRLFDATTNSYKHLFFLALLKRIKEEGFVPETLLSLQSITQRMLLLSLCPNQYFRLSFGPQDMMSQHLESVGLQGFNSSSINQKIMAKAQAQIEAAYADSGAVDLEKYVPYRLLQPFFSTQLKGKKRSSEKQAHIRTG